MIKKLLFTVALVISGIITVNAQCTPDIMCTSLVCPDTVANLPHAQATFLYTTTMTVVVPTDTTVSSIPATVDSIMFNSVTGLPTGFTATADKSAWPGGTSGCLLITGTTTNAQAGLHKLTINITAYGTTAFGAATLPIPLAGYKIIVDSSNGISTLNLNRFALSQNNPNPFSSNTTIEFSSSNTDVYNFTVTNIIGEVVFNKIVNAVSGINKIEFSAANLPSGIYMYKLGNKSEVYTKRMIVSGK
jgi:hypothetical protein